MSNAVEVTLFDKFGRNPAVVRGSLDSVTYRLNRTGVVSVTIPYADPLCTRSRLALSNRAMVRFESGLRDFGGVIDVPRGRNETGVTISIYTGDRILSWRYTPFFVEYKATAPGAIAKALVIEANLVRDTSIKPGDINAYGKARSETYTQYPLLDAIQKLQRESGEDYSVVPTYQRGQLEFTFNWFAQRGRDLRNTVKLVQGLNIETPTAIDEQGPIASFTKVIGGSAGASNWTARLSGFASSVASEAAHGYREYINISTGVFDEATLTATAQADLDFVDNPRSHVKLVAQDKAPGRFGSYHLGDIITLQCFTNRGEWAFDGTVRVLGIRWIAANVCTLEVVEW